jgi:hypothetical protein
MKLRRPRLRLLGRVAGLRIYLVCGKQVRDELDIDFTMGGNEAVYPSYVPPNEIWIDDAAHAHDRTATALHEIIERDQMMRFGKDYDDAHEVASARAAISSRSRESAFKGFQRDSRGGGVSYVSTGSGSASGDIATRRAAQNKAATRPRDRRGARAAR